MAVRLRIDGTCSMFMRIPATYRRAVVSRIKVMANLDIAERRKPQDGKIRYRLAKDREIELRVATLPTSGQDEDVVLRLLTAKQPMSLDAMEFPPATLQAIKAIAEKPHGIILCVGPTGSGKTTTLHAILKHINTDERKIWTAEDPIEITQDGLRQLQVHPKIGLTFATAMRAFLRADPDVIMIGEMRDKDTADIAIEASLTGHLVLSTLHTNSAVETVIRLLDLGCDSFNFADAMLGVLAQRLCKRICIQCKEAYHPSRQEYDELRNGSPKDFPDAYLFGTLICHVYYQTQQAKTADKDHETGGPVQQFCGILFTLVKFDKRLVLKTVIEVVLRIDFRPGFFHPGDNGF